MDAERIRLSRHEAAHACLASELGWRIRLVKIGVHGGGVVDVWPDCTRRRDYCDPAVAPLLMYLMADVMAFRDGGYDGPTLPETLPTGGLRIVSDIICILMAGFASEADPATSYRRALGIEGSDACQIAVLLQHYPAAVSICDNFLAWLPCFLAEELAEPVDAIANALHRPSDTALASSLGTEDVDAALAGCDEHRMARARRRLHAQLDALVFLAQQQNRAA